MNSGMNAELSGPLAANLELLNENLQLKDQVEKLQQQLSAQTAAPAPADQQDQQNAIELAIGILQGHNQAQQMQAEAQHQVELLTDELSQANKTLTETLDLAEQAKDQRNHYIDQCDQMKAMHNREVRKAQSEITLLSSRLSNAQAELKELREMNPQKLKKQVKRLQEDARTKQATNEALSKRLAEATQKAKLANKLEQEVLELRISNRQLNDAVALAAKDADAGNLTDVLEEDKQGGWQIASDRDNINQVYILDNNTDTCRPYHRETGLTKIRPVPPKVTALADKALERLAELNDMVARATGEAQ